MAFTPGSAVAHSYLFLAFAVLGLSAIADRARRAAAALYLGRYHGQSRRTPVL